MIKENSSILNGNAYEGDLKNDKIEGILSLQVGNAMQNSLGIQFLQEKINFTHEVYKTF